MFEAVKFLLERQEIFITLLCSVNFRDKLVADYIYERRLNRLKLREMQKQRTRHEVQLLRVSVLGVLSRLVVDHVGFIAVDDDQIDDTPIPDIPIKEGASLVTRQAPLYAQLQLGVLLTLNSSQ